MKKLLLILSSLSLLFATNLFAQPAGAPFLCSDADGIIVNVNGGNSYTGVCPTSSPITIFSSFSTTFSFEYNSDGFPEEHVLTFGSAGTAGGEAEMNALLESLFGPPISSTTDYDVGLFIPLWATGDITFEDIAGDGFSCEDGYFVLYDPSGAVIATFDNTNFDCDGGTGACSGTTCAQATGAQIIGSMNNYLGGTLTLTSDIDGALATATAGSAEQIGDGLFQWTIDPATLSPGTHTITTVLSGSGIGCDGSTSTASTTSSITIEVLPASDPSCVFCSNADNPNPAASGANCTDPGCLTTVQAPNAVDGTDFTFPTDYQFNDAPDQFATPISAEVEYCFTYTATTEDGFSILLGTSTLESNNTNGTLECGAAITALSIFDASDCSTALATNTTFFGPTTIGTTYTVCYTAVAFDADEGADGIYGTADDGPPSDGDCLHNGTYVTVVPSECLADAGTMSVDANILCIGATANFQAGGDNSWAGELEEDMIFGLYSAAPVDGVNPLTDPTFLGVLGGGDFSLSATLTNNIGNNTIYYVAPVASFGDGDPFADNFFVSIDNDGDGADDGPDCFDVNVAETEMIVLLNPVTAAPVVTCATSDPYTYDVTYTIQGGLPGYDASTFTVSDDQGGAGDAALANGGTYTVSGVAPGTTVNVTALDGNGCTVTVPFTTPVAPVATVTDPDGALFVCVDDAPIAINGTSLPGDFGSVSVTIEGDDWSNSEQVVEVYDVNGVLVATAAAGTFTSNGTSTWTSPALALADGPFEIRVIDTYGDGITIPGTCGGSGDPADNGSVTVVDGQGNVLVGPTTLVDDGLNPDVVGPGDGCTGAFDGSAPAYVTVTATPALDFSTTGVFGGPGAQDGATTNDGAGVFDPAAAAAAMGGPGTTTISYTFTDQFGCVAVAEQTVVVDDASTNPACTTLPIELTSFEGLIDGSRNLLKWVTSTEVNTREFVIERSANGVSDWTTVGTQAAAGNSSTAQYYQMHDNNPMTVSYYRLRSIDLDDSYELSNVVRLERTTGGFSIGSVFPVPAQSVMNIDFEVTSLDAVQVNVVDALGRRVINDVINPSDVGINTHALNIDQLADGVYILVLENGSDRVAHKFVKARP